MIQSLCTHFSQNQKSRHLSIEYSDCLLKFDDVFTKLVCDQESEKESPKEFKFSQRDQQKQLRMDDRLIASASVLLASKFCEIDDNLIMIKEIQDFMKNYYYQQQKDFDKKQGQKQSPLTRFNFLKYEDIARAEIHVLERFKWDMFRIIPLDFFEVYILMLKKIEGAKHSMLNIVRKQGDMLCEQIMVDHHKYLEFMPSDIALAVLVAACEQFTESEECLISKQECEYIFKQLFSHIFQLIEKSRKKYFQQNLHNLKSNVLNEQYSSLQSALEFIVKSVSGKEIDILKLFQKQQTFVKNINLVESTKKQSQNSSYIYTPSKNLNQESSSKRSIQNHEFSNTITANKEFQPIKYSVVQPPIRLYAQSSSKKKQQNQSCQNSVQKNYNIKSPRDSQGSIQKFSFNNQKLSQNFALNNLQRKLEDINKIASSNNILKQAVQNISEQKEHEQNENFDSLISNSQYQTHRKSTKLQIYDDNVYMNFNNQMISERKKNENIIQRNTLFNDNDYYNRIKNPLLDMKKSIKTSDQFSDLQELSPLSDQTKEQISNYKYLKKINNDNQQDEKSKKLSGTRLTLEFSKKCQQKNQYYQKQNQSINYTNQNEKLQTLNLNNLNQYDSNDKNQPLYYKLNDKVFDHDNQYNQFILKKNRSQTADPKNNNISQNQQLGQHQGKEIDYDQLKKQLTEQVIEYEQKKQQSQDSPDPKSFQPSNAKKIINDFNSQIKTDGQNQNNIMHNYLKKKNEQFIRKASEDNKNAFSFNYFLKNKEEQASQHLQNKEEVKTDKKSQIKIGIPSLKLIKNEAELHPENKQDAQLLKKIDLMKNLSKASSRKNSSNPLKVSQSIIKIENQQQNKLRNHLLSQFIMKQNRDQKNQSVFSSKRSQSQVDNLNMQQIKKLPQDKTSPLINQQQQTRQGQQILRIQSDSQFQYFSTKTNVSQKYLQNDILKKTDLVKQSDQNTKLKLPQQISSINKKEQLTSRSTLKKLTSPQNQLQELNKNGNDLMKKTPRAQINLSRNQQNINERKQNSISQNSISKISQSSQKLLKLKQLNDNRVSHKNETANIDKTKTKENKCKALKINEEEDFSCSPVKYKRRNLSALFHSSTSSNQQKQISGQSRIEETLKLPITNEQDDESFEKDTNNINELNKHQNPEIDQQTQINNLELKGAQVRGSQTALKNTLAKNESRLPSAIGDNRLQNQDKQSSSDHRVKSQLQYNSSCLKSPRESIDIFSQKLISIINEGKNSVISHSIKEEEELNASVISQKNQKIFPSKIFQLGMSSVIQRLSQVKEEPEKPQTKKSHYLNILRDHIQKQQNNKKYQNKNIEKQEQSIEKLASHSHKQDSSTKQINTGLLSSQHTKKILTKDKQVENSEQSQKVQNKNQSIIDELIQSKYSNKQENLKTLQYESSYSKLKQTLEKQRFSSNQKNNLSIICEDGKIKQPEQITQNINTKSNQQQEKIDEQQKVQANNKTRQAVITPKQPAPLASSKMVQSESQQMKFAQRKYNMQVHYLQPNKVFQKIYGHNHQDQKEDDKFAKQSNQVQKKQTKQDEVQDQKERFKTPLINEMEIQTVKPVKKSEQSSIMSQISSTSATNKIIKPSLKYNNPFKNQGSIIQRKKQQNLHITNQQQGDSVNLVQNDSIVPNLPDYSNSRDECVQKKQIDLNNECLNDSQLNFEKRFETLDNSKITYKNQTSRIIKKNKIDSNIKLKESHLHQQIDLLFKNTIVSSDQTEANQIQDQEINEKRELQNSKLIEDEKNINFYMKKSNSISNYEFQSYFLNKQRRSIEIPGDKKLIKSKLDQENCQQQESIQSNRKANRNSIQTDTQNKKLGMNKKLYEYKSDLQKFQSQQNKINDTVNDKLKVPKYFQKRNQSNSRLFDSKQLSHTQKLSGEISNINDGMSLNKKETKLIESKKTGEKLNSNNMNSQALMIIDCQEDEFNYKNQNQDIDYKQFNQQELMMIKDEEDLNQLDTDFKNLKKRRSALERKINKTYKVYDK